MERQPAVVVRRVACLCVDMIGSTSASLGLISPRNCLFLQAVVAQIEPHLANCGLRDAVVKFTGDGWLIFAPCDRADERPPEGVCALCSLATVLAHTFRDDVARISGEIAEAADGGPLPLALDEIPHLRLGMAEGYDIELRLPNGQLDYLGDSARRAVRVARKCQPDEILVSQPVLELVEHEFGTTPKVARAVRKGEPQIVMRGLGALRPEVVGDPHAPQAFIHTLVTTGRLNEVEAYLLGREQTYIAQAARGEADQAGDTAIRNRVGLLNCWHNLLSCPSVTYPEAVRLLGSMKDLKEAYLRSGTYASRGAAESKAWMSVYGAVICKTIAYSEAKKWKTEMDRVGIPVGSRALQHMISLAPAGRAMLALQKELEAQSSDE